jgi:hypothetical protein
MALKDDELLFCLPYGDSSHRAKLRSSNFVLVQKGMNGLCMMCRDIPFTEVAIRYLIRQSDIPRTLASLLQAPPYVFPL